MTRLQKLQLEQSEVREKIGGLLDKEDRTDDHKSELEQLTKRAQELEPEIRAAILVDEEPEVVVDNEHDDPETRELVSLRRRSSIYDFVDEAIHGRAVEGASLEFREAVLGKDQHGYFPLDLLLDDDERIERRADAVTNIGTAIQENQQEHRCPCLCSRCCFLPGREHANCPGGDYIVSPNLGWYDCRCA